MDLENLYELVENEGIYVERAKLEDLNGTYFCEDEEAYIILNEKIKDIKTEKVTLVEELGHHFTGVVPTLTFADDYYNKLVRSKNEFRALKWSINKLIPFGIFKSLIKPDAFKYEVAEELEVTEEFIDKVCYLYKDNSQC